MSRAPMCRSPCCIRPAMTTTGCCAPSCIGAAEGKAVRRTGRSRSKAILPHLQLGDLVLVDQAELEFSPGLTALTGETGAVKSIVVDALLLIAGGRGAGDIVRQGAERAEITASFAALPAPAVAWLQEQSVSHEGEIVVRRVVGADGRSRAYVNGQVMPLQALRELAELLIEIHGQQEFQPLVSRGAQRELLDERLGAPALKTTVTELFSRHHACRSEFEA